MTNINNLIGQIISGKEPSHVSWKDEEYDWAITFIGPRELSVSMVGDIGVGVRADELFVGTIDDFIRFAKSRRITSIDLYSDGILSEAGPVYKYIQEKLPKTEIYLTG